MPTTSRELFAGNQFPAIPRIRSVLLPIPGWTFQERSLDDRTPAVIGGVVGRVLYPFGNRSVTDSWTWSTNADDRRPLLLAGANGIPYLRFDGVNDQFRFYDNPDRIRGDQVRLWGAVGRRVSGTSATLGYQGDGSSDSSWIMNLGTTGTSFSRGGGGVRETVNSAVVVPDGQWATMIYGHLPGGPSIPFLNGRQFTGNQGLGDTGGTGPTNTTSSLYHTGGRDGGTFGNLDLAALVIASCAPTAEHVRELQAWLMRRIPT